jgi:polyphosphate glucokinase
MAVFGIDIGGSGIKGAPVDLTAGALADERHRVETPRPATVEHVLDAVKEVAGKYSGIDRVGVTFPGVVVDGVIRTAANMDPSWVDVHAADLFTQALDVPVKVVNDADAAGIAEIAFGAGRNQRGTVVLVTFGTGIGSALFRHGELIPNTEFGHVELHGADAELYASDRIRKAEELDWPAFAKRVTDYLSHIELLLRPDLLIIGGGVSKKAQEFLPLVKVRTPVVPALLQNHAGIIGAGYLVGAG